MVPKQSKSEQKCSRCESKVDAYVSCELCNKLKSAVLYECCGENIRFDYNTCRPTSDDDDEEEKKGDSKSDEGDGDEEEEKEEAHKQSPLKCGHLGCNLYKSKLKSKSNCRICESNSLSSTEAYEKDKITVTALLASSTEVYSASLRKVLLNWVKSGPESRVGSKRTRGTTEDFDDDNEKLMSNHKNAKESGYF